MQGVCQSLPYIFTRERSEATVQQRRLHYTLFKMKNDDIIFTEHMNAQQERKLVMAIFQISSRSAQLAAPPKKKPRRLRQEWSAVIRVVRSMIISALLFVTLLNISGSNYTFILLPVFLSLFITGSRYYARHYTLNMVLNSTLLYFLLTLCLALIYYSVITEGILLTHYNPDTAPIILVTTALAWSVILEPLRAFIQSLIERRFNVRNREAIKAVEAFTSTLREEIDLDQLRERFLTVIQQTVQSYSISLWVRASDKQQGQSIPAGEIKVAGNDSLIAYMLSHPGAAEIDRLQLDSPLLQDLKARAVEIALPLASQGELIGLLALGLRLNGEEYTREDRTLLNTLATQVAPALRVAQMVQEQQEQVRERERIEQELRTAQAIQHAFLPKDVPALPGWQLVPYYQPAREVGGDFYDFLPFENGRLGLVIGDVTGKGIPAALVMTATRTMIRTAAQGTLSPGEVFARVNDLLYAETPSSMFVTCFYAVLDPRSGWLHYANAGHDCPYRRYNGGVSELRATGMPLGMMPGTRYDDHEITLAPGESVLFYSDGLVEAHNPRREMFGLPRLKMLLEEHASGASLNDFLLSELERFTGQGWEQEDDVTLVALHRTQR
jgi:serine phosphatase RsbU (regulator of sigma subunit)